MNKELLFILALLMVNTAVFSQDIRDSSNMNIGKIESNGIVRDQMNMLLTSSMRHPVVVCKLANSGNSEVLVSKINRLSFSIS